MTGTPPCVKPRADIAQPHPEPSNSASPQRHQRDLIADPHSRAMLMAHIRAKRESGAGTSTVP
jgi:hypothetical protein